MNNGDTPAMPAEFKAMSPCGLTKREEFAKTAMQGLLAAADQDYVPMDVAVKYADELLAALNQTG